MDDLINRQAAIANAISGRTREIDGEKWIRVSEVRESIKTLPSAQPIDVQEAYYRGKIDGVKECTAKLKKVNEEWGNKKDTFFQGWAWNNSNIGQALNSEVEG